MERSKAKTKIISLVGYCARIKTMSGDSTIEGIIIDETKNTILIKTNHGAIKRFPKKAVSISIKYDEKFNSLSTEGKQIIGTPRDRVKRIRHKWAKTLDIH